MTVTAPSTRVLVTGSPSPRRGKGERARWRGVLWSIGGIALALLFLLPFVVMLLNALRPAGDVLQSPPTFFPREWQWDTFAAVVSDQRFLAWLRTSIIVSLASTAIVLVVAIPAAYITARTRFRGRGLFLIVVLVTQMFSPTSLVVGIYREFYQLSLVDTYAAIILTNSAFNLAFAVWILNGFFATIPAEVEEAANLDGAGRIRTLWSVLLPLTRPGLITATIFTFIATWNEYVVALTIMQTDDRKPLTVGISSYVTGYVQNWDQLFAASIIAVVPVVILFVVIEKHLVGGLTAGSVK